MAPSCKVLCCYCLTVIVLPHVQLRIHILLLHMSHFLPVNHIDFYVNRAVPVRLKTWKNTHVYVYNSGSVCSFDFNIIGVYVYKHEIYFQLCFLILCWKEVTYASCVERNLGNVSIVFIVIIIPQHISDRVLCRLFQPGNSNSGVTASERKFLFKLMPRGRFVLL